MMKSNAGNIDAGALTSHGFPLGLHYLCSMEGHEVGHSCQCRWRLLATARARIRCFLLVRNDE